MAEDEYLIADEVAVLLSEAGAEVLGPVPTVADALRLATAEDCLDAALLDVSLRAKAIWPVVERAAGTRRAGGARDRLRRGCAPRGLRPPATLRKPVTRGTLIHALAHCCQRDAPPGTEKTGTWTMGHLSQLISLCRRNHNPLIQLGPAPPQAGYRSISTFALS